MKRDADRKVALITGVTGQDGAYLARQLLQQGYQVHGVKRRASSFNSYRVDDIARGKDYADRFCVHYGDMTDGTGLIHLIQSTQPTEIYNLAAQSHVKVSFETPEYTANADAIGTLRLLEAIRILGLTETTRFYQASTSELYGSTPPPQNETTPFHPRSPYAAAKIYAYWITVNYREAYGIHASNGILFNHESPLRGETFVTRKITRSVAEIALDKRASFSLGNLDAKRDWGHARDYCRGMQMILQHDKADDFVLATGEAHSVREFVERAFHAVDKRVNWTGSGLDEVGVDAVTGKKLVDVSEKFFRPTEVDYLMGDPSKAKRLLGWEPQVKFEALVTEMVRADLALVKENLVSFGPDQADAFSA